MINKDKIDLELYLKKFRQLGIFIQDVEHNISYPNYLWKEMGYTPEEMRGMGFLNYVHPEDRPAIEREMKDFLTHGDIEKRSLFRMVSKSGEWRWILSTSLGVDYDEAGNMKSYVGYDHDVTEEINSKDRAEKALREAETLRSAGEIITSKLDLPDTISAILEQAERVISFTSATVQILKENRLEIIGEKGFSKEKSLLGRSFPVSAKIPNYSIINSLEPLIVNENIMSRYPGFRDLQNRVIFSWMGIPLIYKGAVIGIMAFDHSEDKKFSKDDQRLAQAFASQVAIALEHSRLYASAKEQAIRDDLTGCYTRKHLYKCLQKEMEIAKRYGSNLSLVIFDIDNFKEINDKHGHLTGDDVLKQVVELSAASLRKTDILCRFGGEEFIALLPSSSLKEAASAAERIRRTIFGKLKHPDLIKPVSVSLGCTSFQREEGENPELMIKRADDALYEAKKQGKNRLKKN